MIQTDLSAIIRNSLLLFVSISLLWLLSPLSDFFEQAGITLHSVVANALILLLSVVAVFALYFLIELFLFSPARLESEAVILADGRLKSLVAIEERIKPNLAIELDGGGKLTEIQTGSTSETYGGQRYIAISGQNDVACLLCTNIGETTAKNCQVRLTKVWQLDKYGGKEIRILESIPLGWDRRMSDGSTSVDILPNETKRLFIGAVRPNGAMALWQKLEMQPIEYHQLFHDAGRYRIELSITLDQRSPTVIHVDIETCATSPKPGTIGRGSASIALQNPIMIE